MNDIKQILILVYLNQYQDNYLLSEMKELCKFTNNELNRAIDILTKEKYLEAEDNIIKVTAKGYEYLNGRGLGEINIEDLFQDTVTLNFYREKMSFDDIYIPKRFKK